MKFIDTHCHLDAAEFGNAQAGIVRSAAIAGVNLLVVPSVACNNFEAVRKLCKLYPGCAPAYGIHPMYTDDAVPSDLEELRDYLKQHPAVAVGEIGLDFFIPHYDQARQEHFFVEQLKLARDFDLPVLAAHPPRTGHHPQTPAPLLSERRPSLRSDRHCTRLQRQPPAGGRIHQAWLQTRLWRGDDLLTRHQVARTRRDPAAGASCWRPTHRIFRRIFWNADCRTNRNICRASRRP